MGIDGYISELSKYPHRNVELALVAKRILRYFAENECLSTYQVFTHLKTTKHSMAYKNAHKRVHKLHSLNLIKEVKQENTKHGAIYYRLTTGGIFRLIYGSRGIPVYNQRKLLEYYGDNVIFKTFIYPFIERKTLIQLPSYVLFVAPVFSFVDECCRVTEQKQYKDPKYTGIDDSTPVYEMFDWNDLQGQDKNRLMDFLDSTSVKWADESAKIESLDNGSTIKVSENEHSLFIRLNDKKTKAILNVDDGMTREFDVQVRKKGPMIKFPHMTFKQLIAGNIRQEIKLKLPTMLFSLVRMSLNFVEYRDLIRPLLEDKTFLQSTKIAEEEVRQSYMRFMELRNNAISD
jgi:hypothetical protein